MSWIGRLFGRARLERELDKELQFHLDAAAADHIRGGMSPDEARRVARVQLGGLEQVKEDARDARGTAWLTDALGDVRYALRGMGRSPAFSAAAILTLAIGVGANTAVWSILDALMRRSLPVTRPHELHALKRTGLGDDHNRFSHPLLLQLQAALPDSTRIAGMSALYRAYTTIEERPEPALIQLVSGRFFPLLGVRAQHGRLISPDDDRTLGGGPVMVISADFWERRFGRDPNVVGRSVRVNGHPLTIIGIAEPGFSGLTVGSSVDGYVPLVMQYEVRFRGNASSSDAVPEKPWIPQRGISWLTLITRASPDETGAIASRIMGPFRRDLEREFADRDSTSRAHGMRERVELQEISRGFSFLREQFGDPLKALMGSVGLILLIACANLAGLVLARSAARTHEMGIRISLGAKPGRLVRQTLTENLTLAVLGGAVGLLVAYWTTRALLRLASTGTRAIPLDAQLDGRVLAFAFGITVLAGLLFGLAPAVRVGRTNLYDGFKTGGRVVAGGSGHRVPLGRMLVVVQIALSLILVAAAGLFVRTFRNYVNIDPGFERASVVTAQIDVRAAGYTPEQFPVLHERLLSAARAVPGVRSASLSMIGLANGGQSISTYMVPGREFAPGTAHAQENYVTPDFFRTTGIELLSGRGLTDRDIAGGPKVAVVTQSFARHFFGTDSAVGRMFGYGTPPNVTVVGVIRDVRANALRLAPPRMIYHALAQGSARFVSSVEVRVAGRPESVISGLRNAIASVDRNLPIREVVPMEHVVTRGLVREKLVARLAGGFGILALLLAAIGLYGVISYSLARRTNEMGVRLALGASPAGVSWVVLRDALGTIVTGLVVGLAIALPLLKLTQQLVYGLSPHDPATLAAATGLLLFVGVVAALVPALRAARIDPIEAIRAE
jgi:predicted permease